MGVSAAAFESGGKRTEHYIPGVYSRSYNVSGAGSVSSGNLVIIGKSAGGTPLELLEFGNIGEAKNTLISGELLEAVGYAFKGSSDYVPQKVYAVRINNATQASLTMSNGTVDLLQVNSWDYGAHANQLKMWVKSGDTSNSYKIATAYKDNSFETDDIICKSLSIGYCGSGTAAYVSVGESTVTLTETITTEATDDTEETATTNTISISLTEFNTLSTLAARINDTGNFTCEILNIDEDADSTDLDTTSGVDVFSSSSTFYSNFAAFVEALESNPYVGSVDILTSDTRVVPSTTDTYVYFSGGETGNGAIAQWTSALTLLENCDIQIIATPSTDSSVLSLINSHCTEMSSTVNRKERTCWLGGTLNETDSTAITKATGYNNKYTSYVVDCVYASNPYTGEKETINGAMLACALAGMESAMSVGEPLTNKTLNILGFVTKRSVSNMEKLIKKGITVCNPSPDEQDNYVVIRALTTYQKDDLIYNERSMVREDLYCNRDLRKKLSPVIGHGNNVPTSIYRQTLLDCAKAWEKNGYITKADDGSNVWDIVITKDSDKVYLTYSRYLTSPTNFVFITAINHIYTSTTEA